MVRVCTMALGDTYRVQFTVNHNSCICLRIVIAIRIGPFRDHGRVVSCI